MTDKLVVGIFGKLPAHGDFVSRDLPRSFQTRWDEWLQSAIASSQEQLGQRWLDTYLCAPVWRFLFAPQVVDESAWAGILVPSVDKVGRYFPLTLAAPIPDQTPVFEMCLARDWFQQLEDAALNALQLPMDVDALSGVLAAIPGPALSAPQAWQMPLERTAWILPLPGEDRSEAGMALLGGWLLQQQQKRYGLWWSLGSEFVQPSLRVTQGMPSISAFAGFMDDTETEGRWSWLLPPMAATPIIDPPDVAEWGSADTLVPGSYPRDTELDG